jgi:shikimate dehydrogenase
MSENPDRYAVIGHPVEHSRSPQIHAAFAEQTGEALTYDLLPAAPDAFVATVDRFFAEGGAGLNVTLPFKAEAAAYADTLSDRARRAGAVNTLARQADGRIAGDNTDGIGLLRDLERHLGASVAGQRILILGAGGAVRGVVPVLLEQRPAALCIGNRTAAKAEAIAAEFGDFGPVRGCGLDTLESGWDVVINAISAGLSGEMPAVADAVLHGDPAVYDMIYADTPTPFLRFARERGVIRRRDGFGMLVEQAAESFALWRGVYPATADVIARLRPGGARYAP